MTLNDDSVRSLDEGQKAKVDDPEPPKANLRNERLERDLSEMQEKLRYAEKELYYWEHQFGKQPKSEAHYSRAGILAIARENDMWEMVQWIFNEMDEDDWEDFEAQFGDPAAIAWDSGSWDTLGWLLRNNHGWSSHFNNGYTWCIVDSLENGHLHIAAEILDHPDFGVNFMDGEGYTALMRAAEDGKATIVRLLLLMGADPHLRGDRGRTSLDCATDGQCREILALAMV